MRMRHFNHNPALLQRLLCGFTLVALLVLQTAPLNAAMIRLKDKVTVNSPVLTLGDVAEILEPNADKQSRLQEVLLGPAPAPGRNLLIDYQAVRDRLQAVGYSLSEIEFTGHSHIQVRREDAEKVVRTNVIIPASASIPAPLNPNRISQVAQQVGDLISKSLVQQYPQLGRYAVTPTLTEEQTRQFSQLQPRNVQVRGGTPPFGNRQTFLLQFADRTNAPVTWQIPCELKPMPRVLAVRQSLNKGHIVAPEDLGWRIIRDDEIKNLTKVDPEQILGRQLTKNIAAESAISPEDVETVPLVKSNDIVTVISRCGRVTVRMTARSKGAGGQGEVVQVQSLDGKTRLQTRVTGYHEVEILSEQISQEQIGAKRVKAASGDPSEISQFSGGTQTP
ncbi:MAG: flagellar basal body P-ring formation chaperone FlgA [Planctomycetales bacterium]